MKKDMSQSCGFKDLEMSHKRHDREITEEEFNLYWNNYCGNCIHMHEICMYGEE